MGGMGGMLGMSQMGMGVQYPNNGWDQGHNPNPNGKNKNGRGGGGWGGGRQQRNQPDRGNSGSAVGPPGLEKAPSRQAQKAAQPDRVAPAVKEVAAPTVDSGSAMAASVMDILSDDAAAVQLSG